MPRMACYVLDTSAIRAVRRADLEAAAARHEVRMSPWSFWELASHLDEEVKRAKDPAESFLRQRGQVLKCELLRVLDEPFAEHAADVGALELVNPSRLEERLMVPEVLRKLKAAETIETFYGSRVTFPTGDEAPLTDLANNVRRELDAEESRYVEHIRGLVKLLATTFGAANVKSLADDEYVNTAIAPCRNLAERYVQEGVGDADILPKLIDSLYLHLAYKLGRARKSLVDAAGIPEDVKIDPNDFEDGAISLHIRLFGGRVLVTGDEGTARELTAALEILARSSEARGVPISITCRIIGHEKFVREARARPSPAPVAEPNRATNASETGPRCRSPRCKIALAVLVVVSIGLVAWLVGSRR
jgi:hypothetical protein